MAALAHVARAGPEQFIVVNLSGGVRAAPFERVSTGFRVAPECKVRVGIAAIFPYLNQPRVRTIEELRRFLGLSERFDVPVVVQLDGEIWWKSLPKSRKDLFIGLKVGWESSIGVNAWYYPNGNALLDQPPSRDPQYGLKASDPPARGVARIGYAAVKTAGIRCKGTITEADLAEVAHRHLEDLARYAAGLGVPGGHLFTHAAGWKENERLYQAAVNRFRCPGWSFYRHAEQATNHSFHSPDRATFCPRRVS